MGCRGTRSDDAPVHLNRNMDFQDRYDPHDENTFFSDNRAMRMPVPGTVARGTLRDDSPFYGGRTEAGAYLETMPVPTTRELVLRGQERYNIFCSPCHGRVGDGDGIITTGGYGYTPAPNFHDERLREVEDGYLFDVITRGVRTMPPYAHQVPVADRWAIVSYIRALQRSQYAQEEDVPPSVRAEIQQRGTAGTGGAAADEPSPDASVDDTTGAGEQVDTGEPAGQDEAAGSEGAAQNADNPAGAAPQSGGGNQ